MNYTLYILITILIILIIAIIIWFVYYRTCGHQQTLTLSIPFTNTYRYIPDINKEKRYKLDCLEITITGNIKKDMSLITPQNKIKEIVKNALIDEYDNSLLL